MPDVSLSSILLLNTLSIKVKDCSVNLVGNVIFGKKTVVIRLSKNSLKVYLFKCLANQYYNLYKYKMICLYFLLNG